MKISKVAEKIAEKEYQARKQKCIKSAREIFKLIGDNAENLPMGDSAPGEEASAENMQKIMVPIVDEIAQILVRNEVGIKDWKMITSLMQQPVTEYSWRIESFISGFQTAIMEHELGKSTEEITIKDLWDVVKNRFSDKKEIHSTPIEESK